MVPRYTKSGLYAEIHALKGHMGITSENYPLDVRGMCEHSLDYTVREHSFKTQGLQGMLVMEGSHNYIVLNSSKSLFEQNFFCTHEVMHSTLHRNVGAPSFKCYDQVRPSQDSFIEWHANEGAAEFLVPYAHFIPTLCFYLAWYGNVQHLPEIRQTLADTYHVSERVIYNRIESLKYEISEYQSGVPIDSIELMSNKQLERSNIHIKSLNQMSDLAVFCANI